MKKDCAYTKQSLRKYLRGHLFKYEQVRIARHLNVCPVCRSEFQALKKVADTKQLLKDITPPEGLGQRMRQGVLGIRHLKVLLYRPLWLVAIIALGILLYINLVHRERDVEIENIEKSLPPAGSVASAPTSSPGAAGVRPAVQPTSAPAPAPQKPNADPLVVTITAENERSATGRINAVIQGHGQSGKIKFSETGDQITGTLTATELLALFHDLESIGKISYSRRRFESYPAAQPIRFIMKMKTAAVAYTPTSAPVPAQPASAPTASNQ